MPPVAAGLAVLLLAAVLMVAGGSAARSAFTDPPAPVGWRTPVLPGSESGSGPGSWPGSWPGSPGSPGSPAASVDSLAQAAPTFTGEPTRLRIPRIGVDVGIVPLQLDAKGALATPDFPVAGWYAGGTSPGDLGPAVVIGHVDSRTGPAAFHRLHELADGDVVEVARGDSTVTFRVILTAWYPKSRFPTAAVYGPTPDAQLRLITCGGDFDRSRRSYVDNLVVYAVSA